MRKDETGTRQDRTPVLVLLSEAERAELRREAFRRVECGEVGRVSVSALVREALSLAPWRSIRAKAAKP